MSPFRATFICLGIFSFLPTIFAQEHQLSETARTGESFRYEIETVVSGTIKVTRDGKNISLPLGAKNQHLLLETILVEGKENPRKVARHYQKASSQSEVNREKNQKQLSDRHPVIVAQSTEETSLCFAPSGPLSRSELELVAEHFNTLYVTGLLPNKAVSVNDSWKLSNLTVQGLCLFEGLISHELTGKLTGVKEGMAQILIEGKASGIELGAMVNLTIRANVQFDLLKGRIVFLEWKQKDVRDQGPISPASEVESVTTLKRDFLKDQPNELNKAILATVPSEERPNELLKQLVHKDSKGRYSFLHERGWHIVGQTDSHLVMRLLEKGDFVAQATLTWWKKEEAGKHISVDDFKKVITQSAGWDLEEIIETSEIPTDEGRWIYRITARGELDGIKVLQTFYALTFPTGEQIMMTITMKPTNASKIGTRDVSLVNSIEVKK